MLQLLFGLIFILIVTANTSVRVYAQDVENLYAEIVEHERLTARCEKEIHEEQIKKFGKPRPKVSGHCYTGCPILVVKPAYPIEAKRFRFSGQVFIEAIVNETGNVVQARFLKGRKIFRLNALAAALRSKYQPKIICNNKPVKFRWIITYNFRPVS